MSKSASVGIPVDENTPARSQMERVVRIQTQSDQTAQDAALARALAEAEAAEERQRVAQAAAAREAHYARDNYYRHQPYYYGTWRQPPPRPVVVYRDDPCTAIWVFW